MKQLLISLVLVLAMMAATARAQDDRFPWRGTEVEGIFGAETLVGEDWFGLRASLKYIWVIESQVSLMTIYAGPVFNIGDKLWISPQAGGVTDWKSHVGGLDVSLWVQLFLANDRFHVYLQGDGIIIGDVWYYYGRYSVDGYPLRQLNFGAHAEQYGLGVMFGPQVGGTFGPVRVEVQYHVGLQEQNWGQTIRFVFELLFTPRTPKAKDYTDQDKGIQEEDNGQDSETI